MSGRVSRMSFFQTKQNKAQPRLTGDVNGGDSSLARSSARTVSLVCRQAAVPTSHSCVRRQTVLHSLVLSPDPLSRASGPQCWGAGEDDPGPAQYFALRCSQ